MFDKIRHQMNNRRWDNPRTFEDQVDHSNPQRTSSAKVIHTGERFSWYRSDDLRAKIEPPSCQRYKLGDYLAIRPRNCDEIIDENYDDDNWVDPAVPSSERSRPSNANDNDDSEGEEDTQGDEKGTGKGTVTNDGMGKCKAKAMEEGKGKGKGSRKGKGIVKQTPGGDDISRAVAVQLQKELYMADTDREG
jgi:hypothetical protein